MILAFITGEVTEDKFCLIPFYDWKATAMKFLGKPSASTQYQVCDINVVIFTCMFPLSAVHLSLSRNSLDLLASYQDLLIYERNH